jgi:colanic acid/amylovoran biosynthesis glycosyltransferase
MKIAYLVNQYPKVSHSFIRREIAALEAWGLTIERFSIRSCESELVDQQDKLELEKTRVILNQGIPFLLLNFFAIALTHPIRWLMGLWLTLKISRFSQRSVLYHLIYLAEACVLLRWFKESDITHVHAHFGTNSTTVAMLCQAIGGPSYSFTVHGPDEFDRPESLALTEKIDRASFVVTISSFSRSQLYRWCDRQYWKKIHVVRCGVDDYFFGQPTTLIPEEPNLVCVGRLCEQKGQLLLIEAINQLKVEGLNCNLTLVGDGPLRNQIEALIQHYGLEKQVTITGWASAAEVQKCILNSRALVLPSFAEGLPVVIMEALALNRPVISTYVAGIPELVKPGINGWLITSGSVEDLTAAMGEVIQLPTEKLEQMGIAGSLSVNSNHNLAQQAISLEYLFRSYSNRVQGLQYNYQLNISLRN